MALLIFDHPGNERQIFSFGQPLEIKPLIAPFIPLIGSEINKKYDWATIRQVGNEAGNGTITFLRIAASNRLMFLSYASLIKI